MDLLLLSQNLALRCYLCLRVFTAETAKELGLTREPGPLPKVPLTDKIVKIFTDSLLLNLQLQVFFLFVRPLTNSTFQLSLLP